MTDRAFDPETHGTARELENADPDPFKEAAEVEAETPVTAGPEPLIPQLDGQTTIEKNPANVELENIHIHDMPSAEPVISPAEVAEAESRRLERLAEQAAEPPDIFACRNAEDWTLSALMHEANRTAHAKGWWDTDRYGDARAAARSGQRIYKDVTEPRTAAEFARSFGDLTALCHTELSEMYEEFRKHGLDPEKFIYHGPGPDYKPEGIAIELADLMIRIGDFAREFNIPLNRAISRKVEFNRTRPYRHGGKRS